MAFRRREKSLVDIVEVGMKILVRRIPVFKYRQASYDHLAIIEFGYFPSNEDFEKLDEVLNWFKANRIKYHKLCKNEFYLSEKDAMLFLLRWS